MFVVRSADQIGHLRCPLAGSSQNRSRRFRTGPEYALQRSNAPELAVQSNDPCILWVDEHTRCIYGTRRYSSPACCGRVPSICAAMSSEARSSLPRSMRDTSTSRFNGVDAAAVSVWDAPSAPPLCCWRRGPGGVRAGPTMERRATRAVRRRRSRRAQSCRGAPAAPTW